MKKYVHGHIRSDHLYKVPIVGSLCCALSKDNKHICPAINTGHITPEINKEQRDKETGNRSDKFKMTNYGLLR